MKLATEQKHYKNNFGMHFKSYKQCRIQILFSVDANDKPDCQTKNLE